MTVGRSLSLDDLDSERMPALALDATIDRGGPIVRDDDNALRKKADCDERLRGWNRFIVGLMVVVAACILCSVPRSSRSKANPLAFDINGPPPKPRKYPARARSVSIVEKPKEVKVEKELPFPVIEADDSIPGQKNGALPAADALECRDAVIDYVINATDAKDECDGLKKAFDKTCNSDSAQEIIEGKERRQKRRLFETSASGSWQFQTVSFSRSLHQFFKSFLFPTRHQVIFFAEDEVMGAAWDDAKEQVARRLESEESTEQSLNETKKPEPEKPLQSLSLPTTSEHVSDQMLSETLMLQQEEKLADAVAAANNQTNATLTEAAVDAVTSSSAIADTTAAVSAVLNDPTSVEARTCCASILNVFHENCNFPEGEEVSDKRLIIIFFVIAFCGLVKSLIRHFEIRWLPEAGGCILVGVIGGAILTYVPHYDISFDGNWFLRIMVPPIVFEAAVSIDKKSFNRHLVPIVIYAVGGTLMATGITAVVVHQGSALLSTLGLCGTIPVVDALTFGALISSIDPIAVLSVLSNMGMTDTDTIYVVIFGESLLNDGVAIVLFQTLVHFLDESLIIDSEAVMGAAAHFLVVALGSLFVGIASGMACTLYYWVMHGCHQPLVEVIMFFCWAFMPYYICDGIEWSGIVAVVATGVVMDLFVVGSHASLDGSGHLPTSKNGTPDRPESESGIRISRKNRAIFSKEGHLSVLARTHIGFVTEILSTMMETAIFAYLGLFLFSYRYHWNMFHSTIAIMGCCISRGVMIPSMSALANWITSVQQTRSSSCRPARLCKSRQETAKNPAGVIIDRRMQVVLWFAGLRGAMSFALVEHIPLYDPVTGLGSRMKPELKAMTSACIIFTVFVLGGYTFYVMERLGMAPSKDGKRIEMASLINAADDRSNGGSGSVNMDGVNKGQESDVKRRCSPSTRSDKSLERRKSSGV